MRKLTDLSLRDRVSPVTTFSALIFLALASGPANAQTYTTLLTFSGTNGYYPEGGLTLSGSTLYGMTEDGGVNYKGNVFCVNTDGSGYQNLFSFAATGPNGNSPLGNLTLSGSTLYGMTEQGGAKGDGTIFSINTNGNGFTTLLSFSGANGYWPQGGLTLSGSTLYGMTTGGGYYGDGNIFSIGSNGSGYQNLLSFSGSSGANPGSYPIGDLTLSGSTLYGTTYFGGAASNGGTIFRINTDGSGFKSLLSFSGTNGGPSTGDLTLSGSSLFGMTQYGGVNTAGNIFRINTDGSGYKDLWDLTGDSGGDGATPGSALTLSGPVLFGMTYSGGANGYGDIFSINTDGSGYDDLFDDSSANHDAGLGNLTLGGSTLYGMSQQGGPLWRGTVFSLTIPPTPEPSTLVLLGVAALGLTAYAWRRRRAARTAAQAEPQDDAPAILSFPSRTFQQADVARRAA
jgi:uncharacterized repeat protein (TIGR03803 family)